MKKALTIWMLFILAVGIFAQLSPGDLSKSHENLEGMSKCTKCHVLGEKVTNEKCLDCHKEIKNLISQGKGYHASEAVRKKDCFTCHNEHHGRNFQLTRFDRDNFNHNLTGYILEGKHRQVNCNDCHKPSLIKYKISQKKEGSFLGLGTQCLSCHEDYHQQTLSSNCASCHSNDSFSPVVKFDHQLTKFPLLGKHKNVSCKKCHKIEQHNGKPFQQFKGISFNNCTACHKDIHENKFGQDCRQCHNEESFHQVAQLKNFDHSKTNFPLKGKHQKLECKTCHKQSFTIPMAHAKCTDCHSDYHKGQFQQSGRITDCTSCHTENGFTPSLYSIEQHNQTKFKLAGAHLATPCILCHKKNESWEFKKVGENCVDCHNDIHKGYIQEKYYPGQKCDHCHTINAWVEINFDHNKTNFTLSGKHIETPCSSCHFNKTKEETLIQHFTNLTTQCENCHSDVHREQFKENETTQCERCHGSDSWKENRFDHDMSRFKLEGGHTKVNCNKCHPLATDSSGTYIRYKLFKEIKCANCHSL